MSEMKEGESVRVRTNRGIKGACVYRLNTKTLWVKLDNDGHIIKRKYRDVIA